MGKIPRRKWFSGQWKHRLGSGEMPRVLRGVARTGNYDQEQGNKERSMRVQSWLTSYLRVSRGKKPLKKTVANKSHGLLH